MHGVGNAFVSRSFDAGYTSAAADNEAVLARGASRQGTANALATVNAKKYAAVRR
jgi:hypothetical protein